MSKVILYEFFGEEDICNKLVGMTVAKVEYGEETDTATPVLCIDLEDRLGNKRYLTFTDGSWHFGENEGFKLEKSLQRALDDLNILCDECTHYWIEDGKLWCGESVDGDKGCVCNINDIESFTIYDDATIGFEGNFKVRWLLTIHGPEF